MTTNVIIQVPYISSTDKKVLIKVETKDGEGNWVHVAYTDTEITDISGSDVLEYIYDGKRIVIEEVDND